MEFFYQESVNYFTGKFKTQKALLILLKVFLDNELSKEKSTMIKDSLLHLIQNAVDHGIEKEGVITIDGSELFISEGDHIVILPTETHMVKNTGDKALEIYEIQGGKCDEGDIVRLSDKYGR